MIRLAVSISLPLVALALAYPNAEARSVAAPKLIAFVSVRPHPTEPGFLVNDEIYFVRADGSGQRRVTRNAYVDSLGGWAPDGAKMLVYRTVLPPDVGDNAIFVMNADGTHERRLLLDREDPSDDDLGAAEWTPDSKRIVVEINYEIYSMNLRGGNRRKLTTCQRPCASYPAVGPDGRIAYVDVNADIYVMNADGSGAHRIVEVSNPGEITWSPNGRKLLYVAGQSAGSDVFVVNADGTGLRNLTHSQTHQYAATWSPDSRRIAFVRHVIGQSRRQIYTVSVSGGEARNLSRSRSADGGPDWSPDGTRIAFSRTLVGEDRSELFVMAADGSDQRRLTRNMFEDYAPMWQPLSRR